MSRGPGGNSPANVQLSLKGAEYPTNKQALMECARRNEAPDDVMDTIRRLDRDEYGGPQDVMQAYGGIE